MSEDKIIKRLTNIIEINKSFLNCDIQENSNIYKDIQGLLDLYQQEKRKNKELTDEYMIQKYLINADFLKDYISKDKIREIKEAIEWKRRQEIEDIGMSLLGSAIDVLDKLLEEDNNE